MFAGLFFPIFLNAQEGRGDLRFVFYNVENLFDPFDDSLTADDEFLPAGGRRWTWNRFEENVNRIYKVLVALGGWEPPEIIGLCEIENHFVLHRLVTKTPLRKHEYRIIHRDSPDPRGIDVALLYRPGLFQPLYYRYYTVQAEEDLLDPTRDILYVHGMINGKDSLHLFLNHWPSRWEGILESRPERVAAAWILRRLIDSLSDAGNKPRILVAGDFNDEMSDHSLKDILGVQYAGNELNDSILYFPGEEHALSRSGTLKYHGTWFGFDLILANGSLLADSALFVRKDGFRVFAPGFLLEKDPQWLGLRPFRTYYGYRYAGGFSDHLPVFIDIFTDAMQ